jgi:hypothetical protein
MMVMGSGGYAWVMMVMGNGGYAWVMMMVMCNGGYERYWWVSISVPRQQMVSW